MSVRKTQRIPKPVPPEHLPVIDPHAAGIDIGQPSTVAMPPAPTPSRAPLRRLHRRPGRAGRLAQGCGVTSVRHGIDRRLLDSPVRVARARGFEVHLVDPRQTSRSRAGPRPMCSIASGFSGCTATGCCRSFRPEDQVVVLRGYLRQRHMLMRYAGQHVQHMQKALEQMNVKLPRSSATSPA